ncbi:L-2,3-butanediol dehydrogenase/acetoin reductase [Bifidobacterium actinocoloniiforme DSM 22766]|uniref:diacetyl reductase [(S)-acetoin forming] n=1 Tax=Bifidobacterium actinocoloniiforme DSM 22766 TaxID=1437605 RepID=A0A086YZC8_9BIFI|nr:acetoin reductase [Bifidobacterium actinocoloniiforme]AKV54970.1 diacetyl reductase [Bifidobacterium actinocoloniiforme DSM 22766]KFI39628.1 L-2,3-butanediol dehydrogenase/acetoin reductase [Bifidobacterium actinocoloniiforme DSM 22766]
MSEPKVAVVTGAARGIGRSIAIQLAKDGFDVAVADLKQQEQTAQETIAAIEAEGRKTFFRATDVSKRDEVFGLVDDAADQLGGFDVMVNNAGICQVTPFTEITTEQLEAMARVDIFSVVYGIQAAAAKFEELGKKHGRIISASSIAGFEGFPILGAYSGAKFAVRGLTQTAAQELAPRGITVNGYAPGVVDTPMWGQIDEEMGKLNGKPKGENLKGMVDSIAMQRLEHPDDVAGVISFLASDKSAYMTGQTIIVDGGMQYR